MGGTFGSGYGATWWYMGYGSGLAHWAIVGYIGAYGWDPGLWCQILWHWGHIGGRYGIGATFGHIVPHPVVWVPHRHGELLGCNRVAHGLIGHLWHVGRGDRSHPVAHWGILRHMGHIGHIVWDSDG
ncbi:hypothetical protein G9A89_000204 [Geosiphon pyriformis]|nr:hypothetical protein G9A89_000204 [Geosiphon pyriformis]